MAELPALLADWVWLLQGISKSQYGSTEKYVVALMKRLAGALEEVQLLRKNTGLQSRMLEESTMKPDEAMKEALPKYIQGYGTGHEIPKYLRWKGPLRLRPIGKREIEVFVQHVWKERRSSPYPNPSPNPDSGYDAQVEAWGGPK